MVQLLCFPLTVLRRSSALHQPAEHALLGIISGFKLSLFPLFWLFFPFFFLLMISLFRSSVATASHNAGTGQK